MGGKEDGKKNWEGMNKKSQKKVGNYGRKKGPFRFEAAQTLRPKKEKKKKRKKGKRKKRKNPQKSFR